MDDGGRVRAVLVDDHRAVREVVRACLELDGRTDVVGEAGSVPDLPGRLLDLSSGTVIELPIGTSGWT